VQVKEIEIIDVNYIYEFISERECKTITKIIMNIPPNIDTNLELFDYYLKTNLI
jgi:hypothetical protein